MTGRTFGRWVLAVVALFTVAGCGGGGGDADVSTGTLSLSITDATLPGFQAIYVTVDEVQVHAATGSGWTTVAAPRKTVNLLDLVNGVRFGLGGAELSTGHYTQLRLLLASRPDSGLNLFSRPHPFANYFIDDNDAVQELKVPSGLQTGIKIVNGFDINANQTTELILDFDAARSIVCAGSSGQWLLKPTIKVLDTADYAIVGGTVRDAGGQGVAGVVVSAQTVNTLPATDPKDAVTVHAATVTDENGTYKLFLAPGSYNLVAFLSAPDEAWGPGCTPVSAAADSVQSADFVLPFSDQTGILAGTVTIASAPADQHATLSVRRDATCGAGAQRIEVASLNVAAGGSYALPLPAQTYQVVGSTFDRATRTSDATVTAGATTTVDFGF